MRSLSEESGNLALAGGSIAGLGEVGESIGRSNEGIVGVKPLGWAPPVVAVLEHLVEGVPGDDAPEVTTTSTAAALTLAPITAVVRG